uniref:Carboxylic ester hydrolase n=1 Tax=Nothobranchius furzeri TaxID=105023 RepID=A0A1A8ASG0_NOTFU
MAVLGILAAVVLLLETVSAASLGVVYTEGGMVTGKSISLGLFRRMDVFKGIPFAGIPGRFEKPQRHPGWDGILKATEYRNRCLQLNLLMNDVRGNEDCLYLNIWVPHGSKVSTNLPVMVWIYGGAFLLGGSMGANFLDNYLYSGQEIADRGNVIVVTFGYRVGTLGFLSTGDSSLPGNYGLWDQHAAISWVRRNIRKFGGNPDNITIFGQSAGAASVSFQMLSPYSKGLFRRAITQGGVALSPWALQTNPMALTKKINHQLVDTPTEDVKRLLAALTKDKGTLGSENAYSTYTYEWGSKPSREAVKKTVVDIETDYIFLIPTQATLYLHAANATSGRTYSYIFSEPNRLGGLTKPFPSWLGADHADDLHWPAFTSTGHQFLEINSKMDKGYVGQKLRMRFVNFWTSVLPNLPTVHAE